MARLPTLCVLLCLSSLAVADLPDFTLRFEKLKLPRVEDVLVRQAAFEDVVDSLRDGYEALREGDRAGARLGLEDALDSAAVLVAPVEWVPSEVAIGHRDGAWGLQLQWGEMFLELGDPSVFLEAANLFG